MTINYTTLLGLAKPVTGTETGQWGDVVNDEITTLLEDAVANAATFSVTSGNVTLTTTSGAANQARMSTLIITGTPGTTRNVVAPSQAKVYVVINQSDGAVVIKGAATTGVTVGAGQTAQVAWNGSDFVEIGNYVHGNFVVNGNLSVNGNSTLGDGGADTTTINGQVIAANSNVSKATTLSASAPALAWIKGATYTDTASAGGTTQGHAPFTVLSAPTLATSNIVTYTNASTFYIAGAPSASGSATITNPYSMFVAAGEAYLGGAVTMAATTQNLALGTSQTSGTWTAGGASQTGTLTLDQSTKAHTLNIGTGATENATTKTINLGTAGVSGSTTAINIGSAVSGATNSVTINGNPTLSVGTANGVLYLDGSKVATSGSALTFDGNRLTVSSATPSIRLDDTDSGGTFGIDWYYSAAGGITRANITLNNSGEMQFQAGASGSPGWYQTFVLSGTEQMRLTSTGLGIGTSSPGAQLHVVGGSGSGFVQIGTNAGAAQYQYINFGGNSVGDDAWQVGRSPNPSGLGGDGAFYLYDLKNNATRLSVTTSGNLGLGVTPSAWNTNVKAFQFGTRGAVYTGTGGQTNVGNNVILGAGGNTYLATAAASIYTQDAGAHVWYTAPSGTAGNAISFTQAMTLDASGNLGVGTTSPGARLHSVGTNLPARFAATSASLYTEYYYSTSSLAGLVGNGTGIVTGGGDANFGIRSESALIFASNGNNERARITSGGNFKIGGTADRGTTEGDKQLVLFDGTAPVGTLANGVSFYSASGEANVMDAAGNATLLSPHDAETNEWIFRSKHTPTGKVLKIDVERLLKFVNDHFGLDAVHEFIED